MADVLINHSFVSTKPDSPDNSLVSSSEWNANELISGGSSGQVLVRDGSSPTGGTWVDGPAAAQGNESHTGASPSPPLGDISAVATTNIKAIVSVNTACITSGGAASTVLVQENGVDLISYKVGGAGLTGSLTFVVARTPGTYTYTAIVTADSGTFTSLNVIIAVLTIGVL